MTVLAQSFDTRNNFESASSHPNSPAVEAIQYWLVSHLADVLGIASGDIDVRANFERYGLSSSEAVVLAGDLEEWLGGSLSPTLIYEYPTIEALAKHLAGDTRVLDAPRQNMMIAQTAREPIAIVGIGCRFPGAHGPEEFWRLLCGEVDAITEVPAERWDGDAFYDPDARTPGKTIARWGGFLDAIDQFDPYFFGISPLEAARMDPQQRLLLEVAWEALEDAGAVPEQLAGTRTGVFVGISTNDYSIRQWSDLRQVDAYATTGNSPSIAANRLSYTFDFRGPSIAVDTACSSSLVAIHLACRSLQQGECTLALAGGVNLILSPRVAISFTKAGVMSPDGRCKTFDAAANGYVRGEGAAIVILKPLSQALAAADPIYAILRGSAVGHDGRTNGILAPSREAQEAVLREAYREAGISPHQVQYVEAHGTGTFLGDPIEAKALGAVLAPHRSPEQPCRIGSVKTHLGHLEAAAGVAGLIKVALALKHRALPPSLHFQTPNPYIPFDELLLRVQQSLGPWPDAGRPLIAGVSSFGFGGADAHAVLEEAPLPARADVPDVAGAPCAQLLPLSAHNPEALCALARAFQTFLRTAETEPSAPLHDICYSASVRRSHHDYRLALVGRSYAELTERLGTFLEAEVSPYISTGRRIPGTRHKIVFVFPGQGSQRIGMGQELAQQEPVFRATIEQCDQAMRPYLSWSLLQEFDADMRRSRLNEIDVVQPVLFAVEVALAALWHSWGIEPEAVVGHSLGEVAAAYVAGACTLESAARIICRRSQLLKHKSGQGGMVVVGLPLAEARRVLAGYDNRISIGVSNSPTSTVLSGDPKALEALVERLQREDIFCRWVKVDVASHSSQMDSLGPDLLQALEGLQTQPASIPIYSTVTGQRIDGVELTADYWVRNLREPVLFASTIQELAADGYNLFIEQSPHPILLSAIRASLEYRKQEGTVLASLQNKAGERESLLSSLGSLYTLGYPLEWQRLYPRGANYTRLPFYPWQRQRCWLDFQETPPGESMPQPEPPADKAPDVALDNLDDWFYQLNWEPQERSGTSSTQCKLKEPGRWLILADSGGAGQALSARLQARGARCIMVSHGTMYGVLAESSHYQVDPTRVQDFSRLLKEVTAHAACRGVVHLWSLDAPAPTDTDLATLEHAQELGCLSVLQLIHALATCEAVPAPRLWLVTRAVQKAEPQDGCGAVAQAPLWGIGRVIVHEYPELRCTNIDLGTASATEIQALSEELLAAEDEDQLVLRSTARYVARLKRIQLQATHPPQSECTFEAKAPAIPGETPFRLEIAAPGLLDGLTLRTTERRAPRAGQVEIQVWAAGLNFRDVMKALGIYPDGAGAVHLGDECVGRIVALGEGVEDWQIGDEVVAIAPHAFSAFVTTPVTCIVRKPASLCDEQAAALPVAFTTALYALHYVGRMVKGERVLIHAASGGVGLAAVQLSQRAGAEIFATAGSPEKRAFLQALGVQHVMDSRTLAFADEIRELTDGEGVDLVLNSLAGEGLAASLALLRPYGRFLEIGKVDIYQNRPLGLQPFQKSLSFSAIDLDQLFHERTASAHSLLQEVIQRVEQGQLDPLPLRAFPISEAADAFRYMAQGKHIGKLVLSLRDKDVWVAPAVKTQPLFAADATYLITGGLGGIGLTVAEWMAQRGARHLVLAGRHEATATARSVLRRLEDTGVQVMVAQVDVAQASQVAELLQEIEHQLPPLRGIIHAAGVLDDGILMQLDQERFRAVMSPKVSGAWNLHSLTQNRPLDFFVLFSSAASMLGSASQGNYAAANAFLDALAFYRCAHGLNALSINWGPWSQVGLAARPERGGRLMQCGVPSIKPAQGLDVLERLLRCDLKTAQVLVMPVNWSQWRQAYPAQAKSPLFSGLMRADVKRSAEDRLTRSELLCERLKGAAPGERRQLIETYLCAQVAHLIGAQGKKLDPSRSFRDLGVDSLMAVELRNRIRSDLNREIPIVELYKYPTISSFAQALSQPLEARSPLN